MSESRISSRLFLVTLLKSHCHPEFFAHRGEENITQHNTACLLEEEEGGRSNGELLSITGEGNENDSKYPDLAAKFH